MAAYMIVHMTIHDAAYRTAYQQNVPAMVRKHGGEYLARANVLERLEGDIEMPQHLAILTFPSLAAIHAFFDSEEYQPYRQARQANATCQIIAMET